MIETRLIMEAQFVKGEKSKNTLWNIVISRMKKNQTTIEINRRRSQNKVQQFNVDLSGPYFNRFHKIKKTGNFYVYNNEYNSSVYK